MMVETRRGVLVWKFRFKQPARGLIRGILALQRGGAGKSEGKTRRRWVGGPRPDAGTNCNGGPDAQERRQADPRTRRGPSTPEQNDSATERNELAARCPETQRGPTAKPC